MSVRNGSRTLVYISLVIISIVAVGARSGSESATNSKIWVYMTDHGERSPAELAAAVANAPISERSRQRRALRGAGAVTDARDVPVYAAYVDALRGTGCTVRRASRYLNAVSVVATPAQIDEIRRLPFVSRIAPVRTYHRRLEDVRLEQATPGRDAGGPSRAPSALDYGPSYDQINQINVVPLHDAGVNGEGVVVGVFDTGFTLRHEAFQHLDVLAQYDFINNDSIPENEPGDPTSQHNHGTEVLGAMAGYAPGKLIGPAYAATFVLAKTERTNMEVEAEEDDFVRALEWADSIGVDVVSSSLGYLKWYTFADMDGNTAVTTIACDIAASKGITVCNAAGNERLSTWGHIFAPSDGDSVIACGAVDEFGVVAYFSSPGPSADGRTKPNVCALGLWTWCVTPSDSLGYLQANGTSFSTPLIGGAAALLLQMHPTWGPMDVLNALQSEASNAATPNNDIGYGVINTYQSAIGGATGVMEAVTVELALSGDVAYGTILNGDSSARIVDVARKKALPDGSGWEETTIVARDILVPGGASARFSDRLATGGVYWYRAQLSSDPEQASQWSEVKLALQLALGQSAPNPFVAGGGAEASIPYSVAGVPSRPGELPGIAAYRDVVLEVFDVRGARVRTLIDGIGFPREGTARWNGLNDNGDPVASGVYFYRLSAAGQLLTRKMVLIRR